MKCVYMYIYMNKPFIFTIATRVLGEIREGQGGAKVLKGRDASESQSGAM